jgi:hypothetical protein
MQEYFVQEKVIEYSYFIVLAVSSIGTDLTDLTSSVVHKMSVFLH